jgi:hypothetical protein
MYIIDVLNLLPIYKIYCFVLQESIKRTLVVFEDPDDDELETPFLYCIITCMLTQVKLSRLHNVFLFGESRLKCLVMWTTVDGLIDWCLTPTLAVFQLYRGINKLCETRRRKGTYWYSDGLVYGVWRHFQQYFSYIVAVSFIGEGNRSTRRKPPTCRKSLTKFIT